MDNEIEATTLPAQATKLTLRIPDVPLFITAVRPAEGMINLSNISIDLIDPGDLRRLCEKWTEAVIAKAAEIRAEQPCS